MKQKGFTLVELAIVLMIIGLLIGGILKGQELITNARITSTIRNLRSYDAAVISFQDAYGVLPGDITNPATRLPNCSAAKCNTAGNGDGTITGSDENNAFWLHLGAANLVSGIDMNSTWTSGNYSTAYFPPTPIGGIYYIRHMSYAPDTYFVNGLYGHWWNIWGYDNAGTIILPVPVNMFARMDRKSDDGKPWTGDIVIVSGCGIAAAATEYGGSNTTLCRSIIKAGF